MQGGHLFCFFDGHAPRSGFALKNKGVPVTLGYFKGCGSRLLPAGPERGHSTSKEQLPWGAGGRDRASPPRAGGSPDCLASTVAHRLGCGAGPGSYPTVCPFLPS